MRTLEQIALKAKSLGILSESDFAAECARNPVFFGQTVLGKTYPWFQKQALEKAKEATDVRSGRLVGEWPRQHGKTETLGVDFCLWFAYTRGKKQVAIISNKLDSAKEVIKRIQNAVLDNELLKTSISSDYSWNTEECEFTNQSRIKAYAYNEHIRGRPLDLIYCDEVSQYEDSDSEFGIFWGAVLPCTKATKGAVLVTSTPLTMTDLLATILKKEGWLKLRHKAILDYEKKIILWPEKYTYEELIKEKETVGVLIFDREYQCQPLSEESSLFPYKALQKCFYNGEGASSKRSANYFMGADFAISGKARADYSVFVVIEYSEGISRIVRIWRAKGITYDTQVNILVDLYRQYNCQYLVAEDMGLSQPIIQELKSKFVNLEPFRTTNKSKTEIILTLQNTIANQTLLIVDPEKGDEHKELVDELMSFAAESKGGKTFFEGKGAHDDCVMATAMALQCVKLYGSGISWDLYAR